MTDRDAERLLAELTGEEKASLTIGGDFWHAARVDRLDEMGAALSRG